MDSLMADVAAPTVDAAGVAAGESRGVRVWPSQDRANAGMAITINSSGTPLDDLLVEILSGAIRDRGGVVQKVLGRSRLGVA
jgi:hypothetical protein